MKKTTAVLAADGVIEGYGDGTFLGNRNITRYEPAQMVAKALARNPQGTDRGIRVGKPDLYTNEDGLIWDSDYSGARRRSHLKNAGRGYSDKSGGEDEASIWSVNAGYWFGHKFRVYGAYANNTKADVEDYSWQAQARYGNYGDRAKRGDFAIFAGYKRQGTNTSFSAVNYKRSGSRRSRPRQSRF